MGTHYFILQIGYTEPLPFIPQLNPFFSFWFWFILSCGILVNLLTFYYIIRYATRANELCDKLDDITGILRSISKDVHFKLPELHVPEDPPKLFGSKTVAELYAESVKKKE